MQLFNNPSLQRLSQANYAQPLTSSSAIPGLQNSSYQQVDPFAAQQNSPNSGLGSLVTMLGSMIQKLTSFIGGMLSGGSSAGQGLSNQPGLSNLPQALSPSADLPLTGAPSQSTESSGLMGGIGNIFSSITNKLPDIIGGAASMFTGGLGSIFGGSGGGSLLSGITGLFK